MRCKNERPPLTSFPSKARPLDLGRLPQQEPVAFLCKPLGDERRRLLKQESVASAERQRREKLKLLKRNFE